MLEKISSIGVCPVSGLRTTNDSSPSQRLARGGAHFEVDAKNCIDVARMNPCRLRQFPNALTDGRNFPITALDHLAGLVCEFLCAGASDYEAAGRFASVECSRIGKVACEECQPPWTIRPHNKIRWEAARRRFSLE